LEHTQSGCGKSALNIEAIRLMKSMYDVLTPSNYIQKRGIGWAWWVESLDITGFLDSAGQTFPRSIMQIINRNNLITGTESDRSARKLK
jgi:hypothetical protein